MATIFPVIVPGITSKAYVVIEDTDNLTISDLTVGDDLAVTGDATVGGTLGVTGATTLAALTASGAVVFSNASVSMSALPTSDPQVAGQLWADEGVVTVSAGA